MHSFYAPKSTLIFMGTELFNGLMELYYNASRTLNQLVQDRGYHPLPYHDHLESLEGFEAWLGTDAAHSESIKCRLNTKTECMTECMSKSKKWLHILWVEGPTLNVNVRDIYQQMIKDHVKRAIMIYDVSITATAQNNIDRIQSMDLTLYSRLELQFNITHHQFQPRFRVCSKDEKKKILEQFGCTEFQLPVMLYHDPIRKYYGAAHQTLFEIWRKDQPPSYRLVE